MGKLFKAVLLIAVAAVIIIYAAPIAASIGFVFALSAATTAAITAGLVGLGLSLAMAGVTTALAKKPSIGSALTDRLNINPASDAPRKFVFGTTAAASDARFKQIFGNKDDQIALVIALASHKVSAIKSIALNKEISWSGTGIVGKYSTGIISLTPITEGSSLNAHTIGTGLWNSTNFKFTGCAYFSIQLDSSKSKVFPEGLPSQYLTVVDGCPVYDPRRDGSTVGTGSHRASNQSTWQFNVGGVDIGRNPALCLLTYLLGWRINGRLAWGMGIPIDAINLASFVIYANLCEETVATKGGGSTQRYTCDYIGITTDSHQQTIDNITASMGSSKFLDLGGMYQIVGGFDDTLGPVASLDERDVLSGATVWHPSSPIREEFNTISGRYADPTDSYVLKSWGSVEVDDLADGIPRPSTLDLPGVSRPETCQRIAKQVMLRQKYNGEFTAIFGPRAFGTPVGSLVTLSFAPRGFNAKLFRVTSRAETIDLQFQMTLTEESPEIYLWDKDEALLLPSDIISHQYDPSGSELPVGLTLTASTFTGANAVTSAFVELGWTAPLSSRVSHFIYQSQLTSDSNWGPTGTALPTNSPVRFSVTGNGSGVNCRCAFVMDNGVQSGWVTVAVGSTPTTNVNDWAAIFGATKPQDGATRNVFRGAYASGVTYAKGDLVSDQGAVWLYTNATAASGHAPPIQPTSSNTYWNLYIPSYDDAALLASIEAMQSDSILSRVEKKNFINTIAAIDAEKPELVAQAAARTGVSSASYVSAYSALKSFLAGLSPAWDNQNFDTGLPDATTLLSLFEDYVSQREALKTAIGTDIGSVADGAALDAATALSNAAAASTAATTANTLATSAAAFAVDVGDNLKFSKDEKKTWITRIQGWGGQVTLVLAELTDAGLTAEYSALNSAWTTLNSFLNSPLNYTATTTSTSITSTQRTQLFTNQSAFTNAAKAADLALSNYALNLAKDGNVNLITDPLAERLGSTTEWQAVSSGVVGQADSLGRRFFFPASGSQLSAATPFFPISNNDILDIEFDYYVPSGIGNTSNVFGIFVDAYDSAGTTFKWNSGSVLTYGSTTKNVWRRLSGRIVVSDQPNGSTTAKAFAYISCQAHSSQPVYVRNPRIYRAAKATQLLGPSDGRATTATILPTSGLTGLRYVNNTGFTLSQANAGSSVTVTAGSMSYTFDTGSSVTYSSTSIGGLAYSTTYYFGIVDPNLGGGSGYVYSTNIASLAAPGYCYVGYITTMSSGGTGGSGGSGGKDYCVDPLAFVEVEGRGPVHAGEIVMGDRILALTEDHTGLEFVTVEANIIGENWKCELVSESGASLALSINTPVPDGRGGYEMAMNAKRVPAGNLGGFAWEHAVRTIPNSELGPVAKISCGGRVYGAGMEPGRYLFTHNVGPVKP